MHAILSVLEDIISFERVTFSHLVLEGASLFVNSAACVAKGESKLYTSTNKTIASLWPAVGRATMRD